MDKFLYAKSNSVLIESLGARFKDYRKRVGMSQKQVAEHSGLSVFTISTFESGRATGITLDSFMKLLRAIEQLEQVQNLLPELPLSAKELFHKQTKRSKR